MDATSSDRPVGDYVGGLAKPVEGLRVGVPRSISARGWIRRSGLRLRGYWMG